MRVSFIDDEYNFVKCLKLSVDWNSPLPIPTAGDYVEVPCDTCSEVHDFLVKERTIRFSTDSVDLNGSFEGTFDSERIYCLMDADEQEEYIQSLRVKYPDMTAMVDAMNGVIDSAVAATEAELQ